MTTIAESAPERRHPDDPGRWRSRLLTIALLVPASFWYLVLLLVPLAIVVIFSFGTRAKDGGYAPGFTLDNYLGAFTSPDPFISSFRLAVLGTGLCLLVGLPFAYFLATRAGKRKGFLILLIVIPFWTSFLIRTYAWLTILGPRFLADLIGAVIGSDDFRILGTEVAVLIGIVYGYLPLMIFPLFVSLERMDRSLVEASKDLGAGRWATFRQITFPIALPGIITGSILVFIPLMGEYVVPAILGYGRIYLVGNALVTSFLDARNWPAGAAQAVGLIIVMLVTITFYMWSLNRGRKTRQVSVL
jgi:spermidine/putrescine transport system permease protein